MKKIFRAAMGLLCALVLATGTVPMCFVSLAAESFSISGVFSDGAVLQQGVPVKITGFGDTGAQVTASLSASGKKTETVSCLVNERGKWTAEFPAHEGSYLKYTFTAKCGKKTLKSIGILFGEVWIAGGEGRMASTLSVSWGEVDKTLLSQRVRICTLANDGNLCSEPVSTALCEWKDCSGSDDAGSMPEISCMFALSLGAELEVPVGIVNITCATGSQAAWLGKDYITSSLASELTEEGLYDTADPDYYPSSLFNSLISPVSDLYAAGVLWSCGEGDRGNPSLLTDCVTAFLAQSQTIFRHDAQTGFDVILLQNESALDSYTTSMINDAIAKAADTADYAWSLPAYDIGRKDADGDTDSSDASSSGAVSSYASSDTGSTSSDGEETGSPIPESNSLWGRCLALALSKRYGAGEYEYPVMLKVTASSERAEIVFSNVGKGLVSGTGETVDGFCLVYDDTGVVVPLKGEITGQNTVSVAFGEDAVLEGAKLGYAFGDCALTAGLRSSWGNPAMPFSYDANLGAQDIQPLVASVAPVVSEAEEDNSGEDMKTMIIVISCIAGALILAAIGIIIALRINRKNNSIL